MTNLRQAAKAVVDRWDTPAWEWRDQGPTADLMADLRTALAQPEQEPSQWRDMVVVSLVREGINKHRARELADHFATPLAAAQPEQEPVACRFCHSEKGCWAWQCYDCGEVDDVQKPTPPAAQRPWQGLTDEDRRKFAAAQYGWEDLLIAAEAKLKERNT
jgi:hypothetical protein